MYASLGLNELTNIYIWQTHCSFNVDITLHLLYHDRKQEMPTEMAASNVRYVMAVSDIHIELLTINGIYIWFPAYNPIHILSLTVNDIPI